MRFRLGLLVMVGVVGISGCGLKGGHGAAPIPTCSDQWVKGKTLPKDYKGCLTRTLITPDSKPCKLAKGKTLVTYETDGRLYSAIRGGKIDFFKTRVNGIDQLYAITC